ncbi:MAG: DUF3090 family protein [Anaerolineae bacterium]
MGQPETIELSQADFITIDTIGPPGQRTFYLQAAQGEMLITLIIEKMHAAALSIAIGNILKQLGEIDEPEPASLDLIQPVEPLFRVGKLGLGYNHVQDMLVVVAEELVTEEGQQAARVHIWASPAQMAALARKAATAVAAGRPICPLCREPMDPGEKHVCVRGNGRKRLYEPDEDDRA